VGRMITAHPAHGSGGPVADRGRADRRRVVLPSRDARHGLGASGRCPGRERPATLAPPRRRWR
jgi:hypothetical protein